FRVRAHRFFFLRREPAFRITRREAAMAHDSIVARRFGDAGFDLSPELRRHRALRHDALAADELAGFLEDARCVRVHELVEAASDGWIRRQPARAVRAAAYRCDDEILDRHRCERCIRRRFEPLDGLEPRVHAFHGAAGLLDHEQLDRSAARFDRAIERLAVEAFAAERNEQHGADVRMRAELLHHAQRIRIRVATRKADEVNLRRIALRNDQARDVVRTLDEIGDRDDVANAFASVGTNISAHDRRLRFPCESLWRGGWKIIAFHVVQMDVLARRDVARRGADARAVLEHRAAWLQREARDLVAERNRGRHPDLPTVDRDLLAFANRAARDEDIVLRV